MFVGERSSREKGEKYEAHAHSCGNDRCGHGRSFGLRDEDSAASANHLCGRNDGPGRLGLPDPAAAPATPAGYLPRRIDSAGRFGLPDPAATAATAPAAARRRTRLSDRGGDPATAEQKHAKGLPRR